MALPLVKKVALYVDNREISGPTHPRHHHEGKIIKKAKEERDIELILRMDKEGFTIPQIARVTQKSEDEIKKILNEHRNV